MKVTEVKVNEEQRIEKSIEMSTLDFLQNL